MRRRHYSRDKGVASAGRGKRQADDKGDALVFLTLHRDGAPMQLHKLTRIREPQPGSREAPDHVRAAMETVEDGSVGHRAGSRFSVPLRK